MVDWEVREGERLPEERFTRQRVRRWRRWLTPALVVLVVILAVTLVAWRQLREADARLREDIAQTIAREEQALRLGVVGEFSALADPVAPPEWLAKYQQAFQPVRTPAAMPELLAVRRSGETVVATLARGMDGGMLPEQRAYRLVGGTWRRTPLAPHLPAGPAEEQASAYFMLQAAPDDLATLAGHADLQLDLEALRARVLSRWPHSCAACRFTLVVQSQEFAPAVYGFDGEHIFLNSPSLAQPDPLSPLSPAAQYRYAVASAVVERLTTPVWLREHASLHQADLSAAPAPVNLMTQDWLALLWALQETEARLFILDEEERRLIRNAWRDELAEDWPFPFERQLPLDPARADPEGRRRWAAVNLLIEHRITRSDDSTPARLARILFDYPVEHFNVSRFFTTLIGGSLVDLETISHAYLLQPEP
jgi:hypothetical protein